MQAPPPPVVFNGTAPATNQNFVKTDFQVTQPGKYLCFATGSAWTSNAGLLTVKVKIDGRLVGNATVFSNEAASHKALVPLAVVVDLTGVHTAEMSAGDKTNVDHNDRFTLVLTKL